MHYDSNSDSNSSRRRPASAADGSAARAHALPRLGPCHTYKRKVEGRAAAAAVLP